MSESTFPFAGDDASDGGGQRKIALLAVVGALVVAVLGYFVVMPALAGGGSESTDLGIVRKAPKASAKKAAAKPAAKKAAPKAPVLPASYSDVSARTNPFRELWVKPKTTTGGPTAPGAGAPAAPSGPQGTVPGSGSGSTGGSSTQVSGQRVSLMTVFERDGGQFAQTKVGDVVYTPRVGQVFAVSYKLLAVSGKTATYLYGDEQFTLSVGQEVLK